MPENDGTSKVSHQLVEIVRGVRKVGDYSFDLPIDLSVDYLEALGVLNDLKRSSLAESLLPVRVENLLNQEAMREPISVGN